MPKHKSASYSESDAKLQEIFLHIRKSLTITNVCSNNLIETSIKRKNRCLVHRKIGKLIGKKKPKNLP
ncbi:hypothetical protein DSO57_1008990 [Entomophthora muscae]|uniref:Uncharacterized protein n=1 Tax=Entomophthora muscae TaxID=34485 RepID=A0ACC2TI68_9FUNG|nr:hypothetical protein DSO57_1008990 [Entomophthora muscae]